MAREPMGEEREQPLGAAERRAREAVRVLPPADVDPDFRARLGDEFTSGALARATRRGGLLRLPWHDREMTRWAVAAAAAALLVAGAMWLNRGPSWKIVSAHGSGVASLDGRGVMMTDPSELEAMLHAGTRVALPADADLALMGGRRMMLVIEPGSDVTLPGIPGRWFGRRVEGRVENGVLRVTTGPEFRGAALSLRTPDARVQVTGTTFTVIAEPAGTCVCVLEGLVKVGPPGAAMADVPAGMRGYVHANGAPMERDSMRSDERLMLGRLREQRDRQMGPPAR